MIKAVIFDMDGVLVDNYEAWLAFDKHFLSQYGAVPNKDYITFVNGRSEEEVVKWAKNKFKIKDSVEKISAGRQTYVRAVYEEGSQPQLEVDKLLDKLKQSNLDIALASGAKMWQIEIVLNKFNWHKYFSQVVSSDHVGYRGKPDPEIYLHTARLLNLRPEECVVIEDSENGVVAAKGAGMVCIGYKNIYIVDDLSKADFIINSFTDKKLLEFLGI